MPAFWMEEFRSDGNESTANSRGTVIFGLAFRYDELPWRQYVSTNVALPLSQWTPLATNTFNSGSFSVTNTVNPGVPQSFYILHVQ
jgi:hypothetical protein